MELSLAPALNCSKAEQLNPVKLKHRRPSGPLRPAPLAPRSATVLTARLWLGVSPFQGFSSWETGGNFGPRGPSRRLRDPNRRGKLRAS